MYRLVTFGTTNLEYPNQVDNVGSGQTPMAYFNLPDGGALDGFGSSQKAPGVVERTKSIRLQAASEAALSALYFGLLGLRGKRDKLYRKLVDNTLHWQYARLTEITASRSYELSKYRVIQDLELVFECQESTWRGDYQGSFALNSGRLLNDGHVLDSTLLYALDSNPKSITIILGTDAGRAPIRGIRIVTVAGSAAITSLTIARAGGESLTFLGAIPAGGLLELNCGTMQVLCDAIANPYDYLVLSPAADLAAWFTLQPGANPITVTYTGGGTGSKIAFTFYEAWY